MAGDSYDPEFGSAPSDAESHKKQASIVTLFLLKSMTSGQHGTCT
jgi:hypothetical protein